MEGIARELKSRRKNSLMDVRWMQFDVGDSY